MAREKYIEKSVQLREDLSFAKPDQVLKAMEIYCSDAYGSMIWDLMPLHSCSNLGILQ